ncbi:MAG: Pycsar system effector family protein [Bacteroidota bacterium]
MENTTLLAQVEEYTSGILKEQLPPELVPYYFEYTKKVVELAKSIGSHEQLSDEDMEMVQIAAWFHDTGLRDTYANYEEKSVAIATEFLQAEKVLPEKIDKILACILAVRIGDTPEINIEYVLADARKIDVQEQSYKSYLSQENQELHAAKGAEKSEVEQLQNYLGRILKYEFYTAYGKEFLQPARGKLKSKVEKRLNKLLKAVDESLSGSLGVSAEQLKAMKKKLRKVEGKPERGIETMFRLTSKNHIDLSGMADSKANIVISINSIIISVVLGSLMQKLDSNPHLIPPTIILLSVNLASLVFAILSLRPNVSDGLFTRQDIENQKTNLLFFGNFHKMKREDYHWGMNKLMESANFLYSNLIDDIYFLGVVLARKYRLLRTSYNIFMYGMIVVVVAFIISLSFVEEPITEAIIHTLQEEN